MKRGMTLLTWIASIALLLNSCSENGSTDDETNRFEEFSINIIGATEINPEGDGSGTVSITVVATNATRYDISFGDGNNDSNSLGTFNHSYNDVGTSEYSIRVFAYFNDGSRVDRTESVTVKRSAYTYDTLVWSDEFDYEGEPNPEKWGYDLGNGCPDICGWGNNEYQFYTSDSENVEVSNGSLFIHAKKGTREENNYATGYTSTKLKTKDIFEFSYGRVEIRAKLPQGGGTWPAFWMLGSDLNEVGWPACGEIDIMEHVGNEPNFISSALHTPASFGATINYKQTGIDDAYGDFHTFSLFWSPQKMEFSLDGNLYYTFNPGQKDSNNWPFDHDMFLILNTAVGGNLGGDIDTSWENSTMEIDYIRVYQ
jgi:beta-glucanase (GH16 family)